MTTRRLCLHSKTHENILLNVIDRDNYLVSKIIITIKLGTTFINNQR